MARRSDEQSFRSFCTNNGLNYKAEMDNIRNGWAKQFSEEITYWRDGAGRLWVTNDSARRFAARQEAKELRDTQTPTG